MVAFQQHLSAAAHAHQAVSQFVEASVAVGAEEGDGQQRDEQELGNAKFRVSSFKFQVSQFQVSSFKLWIPGS
jgi:hypothetical protein